MIKFSRDKLFKLKVVVIMKAKGRDRPQNHVGHKILTAVGVLLCIVLLPMLLINTVLIVKGTLDDTRPPSIFGVTPLVVLSGSMDDGKADAMQVGDMILVKDCDTTALKVGDVIAFMENGYTVTHRITAVNADGTYITKGDANNTEDLSSRDPEDIIGIYQSRIPGLGNFAMFIQSSAGMICFVGIPLLVFVIYDVVRRQHELKKERLKQDELKQELEQLKSAPQSVSLPKEILKEPIKEAPVETPKEEQKSEPAPEMTAEPKEIKEEHVEETVKEKVEVKPKKAKAVIKVSASKK